jgi:hypothetical protein
VRYLLVPIMIRVEDFYFYNMHDVCECVCLLWNISISISIIIISQHEISHRITKALLKLREWVMVMGNFIHLRANCDNINLHHFYSRI